MSDRTMAAAVAYSPSREFPKFRHNLWTLFEEDPSITYLTVSHSTFEVATAQAETFLKFRSHCTGHNSIAEIARRSGVAEDEIRSIVTSLAEARVLRQEAIPFGKLTTDAIRDHLESAVRIWAEQLQETGIAAKLATGRLSRDVLAGWLLETYHYIRFFPETVGAAAAAAKDAKLKAILAEYANQERGHERYILDSLVKLGFTKAEVESSIPLVSTRLVEFLMREMFAVCPCSALLLAGILEAGDLSDDEADEFFRTVSASYGTPPDAFEPVKAHMMLDAKLGHADLAKTHRELITFENEEQLNRVVNMLHDIKHAFDVQTAEIIDYYGRTGDYIPRQKVDYFGV